MWLSIGKHLISYDTYARTPARTDAHKNTHTNARTHERTLARTHPLKKWPFTKNISEYIGLELEIPIYLFAK